MKNKFIIIFVTIAILVAALTGFKLMKSEIDGGITTTKLRSSGATNNLIIEKIQNSTNNPISQEVVLVTLRTEWDGLYFETSTTASTPSALTDEDKRNIIAQSITTQNFIENLVPETDETTTGTGIKPPVDPKIFQYILGGTTSPIAAIELINDSGKVYQSLDSTTKYDFVFVVEANTTATDSNIKTALTDFTKYLNDNAYDYRTNIIEIGGKKAIYQQVSGTTKYNLHDALGTSKINLSNDDNSSSKPTTYNLVLSNMDKTKVAYPQDVKFADVKYPTTTTSEFFLQSYATWLSSKTNIATAIGLIGKYNLTGSTFKTSPGSNGLYGLYEATNFLKANKDTSRKQVIVYIGSKEMNADIATVKEIPQFSSSTFTTDALAKSAFTTWFNNEVSTNNFLVLNSSPLSTSTTLDGNPYITTQIDRLGHTISGTYSKADNKLYLLGLKSQLVAKLFEYESGSNQTYLKDALYNFIGSGRYYQKWYIKFTNTNTDIATDKWKKLLFSLGDFKINYDDDSATNPSVVTTTVLKKPIAEADQYFYPGKSADILAVYPTEKYYDRYYYTNANPTIITFTNPNESKPIWYPDSQQVYILNFNFSKANTSNKLPDGTALTSLKLLVKNNDNMVIDKTYTRTDIVQNETSLGGWGLTETKDKYLVSVYFTEAEFKSLQAATKSSHYNYLTFDVTGTINNELVQNSIKTYVDIRGPEISGSATATNQTAKDILKALGIFRNDPLEDEYITALTSTDPDGYLYLRSGTGSESDITFNFTVYDENPAGDTVKYYDTVIHAKIASNFIGQHIVTTYDTDPTNKYVDVDITGELKPDTLVRDIEIQDSFGNKSIVRVIDAKPVFLNDPVPLAVNLATDQINDYTSDSTVDISPKIFVKGGTRDNYDLTFSNSTFADGKIIGLLLPFTQDISKTDTSTSGTVTYLGRTAKSDLNYEAFKSATIYPTPANIIYVSGYLNKANMLSRKNASLYDGIYGVNTVLPVNRAGGIASFVYDLALSGAYSNADTNVAKLSSPITTNKYVVDTIPPKLKNTYKTGVSFKDATKTYLNNVDFILPETTATIDSAYPAITYKNSLFTGNISTNNLKAKPGDIYTITLNDVSLKTKNTSPGDLSASTSTVASAKFYTYKIDNSSSFSAEDLANNVANNLGTIGTVLSGYPIISDVGYGFNITSFDNLYFSNKTNNLFRNNSYASAVNFSFDNIKYLGTVMTSSDIIIPSKTFELNGNKPMSALAFDNAGWVKANSLAFVYDNDINTTNTRMPSVIFTKVGANTWQGFINFGSIYEFVGIKDFNLSGNKATSVLIPNKTFTTTSSDTIISTGAQVTIPGSEKKLVEFIYNSTIPPMEYLTIEIIDKLDNKKNFSLDVSIINTLKLLGTSNTTTKQRESIIDIKDGNIEIRSTQDTSK